jgi:tripartite-type tricarboxylate transporter receptor subunit TctC
MVGRTWRYDKPREMPTWNASLYLTLAGAVGNVAANSGRSSMRALRPGAELVAPALIGLAALVASAAPAAAQADFYKGKTVEVIISTGAGGGLDANGRIVARHLGNHIPGNPTVVAKNMPGAGHIRAANYVFNQAPKDGTTIGTFIPIFVMAQVLERSKSIQFNPANFQWLVSTSSSNSTVYVWHTTGVKSLEDAMQRQVLMGGTGVGSYNVIYPTVLNSVVGTRFRLVMGYASTTEIAIAMERGEVQGRAGNNFNSLTSEHADWLKAGKINLLAQVGLERDREFPDVPLVTEFAKTDEARQILQFFSTDIVIGRPFVTSPGVPAERVALLRQAFDRLLKDPAFLDDSKKAGIDISPVAGTAIQKIVTEFMNTPANIVVKAKAAMEPGDTTERKK